MKFERKLISFIESIDIFGKPIVFTVDKNDSANTVIGGISTILLVSFMTVLFWIQVQSSFLKTKPTISSSIDINDILTNVISLNLQTMPIAFALRDMNGTFYNDLMHLSAFGNVNTNGNSATTTQEKLPLINCTNNNFSFLSSTGFSDRSMANFLCIKDQNVNITSIQNQMSMQSLNLKVSYCDIGSQGGQQCNVTDIRKQMIQISANQNIYLYVYYQNSAFKSLNYSLPIMDYLDVFSLQFDANLY